MLDAPVLEPATALAIQAWNWLHNGHGAWDWQGLPIVCALLGVSDVERLLHDMLTIKAWEPADKPGSPGAPE